MSPLRLTVRGLVSLLVLLPILFSAGMIVIIVVDAGSLWKGLMPVVAFGGLVFCGWRGARLASCLDRTHLHDGFFLRYRPVVIALGYTLSVAMIAIALPIPEKGAAFSPFTIIFGWSHLFSSFGVAVDTLFSLASPWAYLAPPLAIEVAYGLGMAFGYRSVGVTLRDWRGGVMVALLWMMGLGFFHWRITEVRGEVFLADDDDQEVIYERPELEAWRPFRKGNRLVAVEEPGLKIAADHPRWDGSTALFPVYAAAVQAIYTGVDSAFANDGVISTKTPNAIEELVRGEVDIIMTTPPSAQQIAAAEAQGVTLEVTPVGREAFVFFVHESNPVRHLTTAQLQAIYRKEIREWQEVGGASKEILPFQRPNGSGSQTAFLRYVMQGQEPASPLQQERASGMGGIIREVASYRNSERAIGYSFRFYLTTMDATPAIRMLAIDGVEPTRESIRDGSYPFTAELCLVTAGSRNPHLPRLKEWFLSPKGQELIEKVGYVGVVERSGD